MRFRIKHALLLSEPRPHKHVNLAHAEWADKKTQVHAEVVILRERSERRISPELLESSTAG